MATTGESIDEIRRDLASADAEIRGRAMHGLALWLRKDAKIGPVALGIFRTAIPTETDAWTATSAARGIESLLGPDAARPVWRTLLERPDAVFAHRVALAAVDPSHVPLLLGLLESRTEPVFRIGVLHTLGRSKDPEVFSAIAKCLPDPATQCAAIQALGDLGDARALPLLAPLRDDRSPSGQTDDRGWPLDVGEITGLAVRQIEQAARTGAVVASAPPAIARQTGTAVAPPPLPYWRRVNTVIAFVPLVLAVVEVPWAFGIFVLAYAVIKDRHPPLTHAQGLIFNFLWLLPVAPGAIIALALLLRWRTWGLVHWLAIIAGGVTCGLISAFFIRDALG